MTFMQYRIAVACVVTGVTLAGVARGEPLTLEAAVRKGLTVTEDVKIAQAQRAEADAGVAKARAALLPDLVASGTYTRRSGPVTRETGGETITVQTANALSGTVTASSTIFDASAVPLLHAARRERDAAALDVKDQQRRTELVIASAFLTALGDERIVSAATDRRDLAKVRRDETSARVENQLTGKNDLTQAELELATAERDLAAATGALADAYAELSYQIGEPVTGPLAEPTWLYELATSSADPTGTATRPDLAAARVRIDEAVEAAKEPERRWLPVLGVFGQVRFTNEPGLSGRNADWSVGVTATWTLWDGGERAADSRVAEARVDIARIQAEGAERLANAEVSSAAIRLRTARTDVTASQTQAEVAARNADEVTALYGQGLVRAFEVSDATSKKFAAEVAKVQATIGLAAAYLDLAAASGTTWLPAENGK